MYGPQGHWVSGVSWGVGVSGGIGCGSSMGGVRGTSMGCRGHLGLLGGVRGCIGSCQECRYSGARRGIGGIREALGLARGCRGHWGAIRGISGCRSVRVYRGC